MKRTIIAAVAFVALVAGCGSSTGGGNAVETQPVGGASSTEAGANETPQESQAPEEQGDWKFSKVSYKVNSVLNFLEGTMRATNITGEKRSGLFTVTLLNDGGDVVATLSGAANDVPANRTVTVKLIGTDEVTSKQVKSITKTEVQVDGSF